MRTFTIIFRGVSHSIVASNHAHAVQILHRHLVEDGEITSTHDIRFQVTVIPRLAPVLTFA